MPYDVRLNSRGQRQLDRIPDRDAERISAAIVRLGENQRPRGVKRLTGRPNVWRIRVGEYRIIYSIFAPDRLVIVDRILRRTTTTYEVDG